MRIPLATEGQPCVVKFRITAQAPGTLAVVANDPKHPFSVYFSRWVHLETADFTNTNSAHVDMIVPFPLAPQRLDLIIQALEEPLTFEVSDFQRVAFPALEATGGAAQHRFMDFASQFAQQAGYLKPGFYPSPQDEFLIQYLPEILGEDGQSLQTPARIHREMPRVQVSQAQFRRFTIPMRVVILAHEHCHWQLNTRDEELADACGIKYYAQRGFPRIEGVYSVTQVFGQHADNLGPAHYRRVENVMRVLNRYSGRFNHLFQP